jgi:hypothetical protein
MPTVASRPGRGTAPAPPAGDALLAARPAAGYNEAEQEFSRLFFARIEQLLKGQRNSLLLLRRYPRDPRRIGVMPTPSTIDRDRLRVDVVDVMASDAIAFLSEPSPGGPVTQEVDHDGNLVETRHYATKYPHIVLERFDCYRGPGKTPESIEWHARRVQNQRTSTMVNRVLDAANLGFEVVKYLAR